jgi:hypothetical protein
MAKTKQTSGGRNGAASKSAKSTTSEAKLRRFVLREEARGAYRHFPDPAKALAELRKRSKKPRHALRTAAA